MLVTGRRAAVALLTLVVVAGATLPWVACARESRHWPVARAAFATYSLGHLICHQRPDRSFTSCGHPWPVCGRCAGIYLGAAVGVWLAGARRLRVADRVSSRLWRRRLVLAALPTAALWAGELILRLDPGTLVRFIAALPAGAAGAAWLLAVAREDLL
jgi:uncharacterized membrane protein